MPIIVSEKICRANVLYINEQRDEIQAALGSFSVNKK